MANDEKNAGSVIGLAAGTRIGKYEIIQRLAIGGQAIIYKAVDPLLDRFVAIKQISSHLAEDTKFLDYFRKEAKVLAKLGSEQPSIVTIHELIENERGLFIVMEFVSGHSLAKSLEDSEGPMQTKAALQIIWRLAAALHAIHAAGIIHRDIKPSNIIVGEGLWPTIVDFGVSASLSGQTSMVLGTTKYMAPELFGGENIDARADMYSLGIIAYEMFLGCAKFSEIFADIVRDPRSATVRWMKWHGNKSVKAPKLHEVNKAIPESLSNIVSQMMAKDRDERFGSMEALGRAIKETFSPRARAAAMAAKSVPDSVDADSEGVLEVIAEEPHEIDETLFEPEPTARLPKSSLSLRTKLILVGFAVVGIIAIGVVLGLQSAREKAALREQVDTIFKGSQAYFDAEHYVLALEGFEKLENEKKFSDIPESAKASVLAHLCRGYGAIHADDWVASAESADLAKRRLNEVQREWGSKIDAKWVTETNDYILRFNRQRLSVRGFDEAIVRARAALEHRRYKDARAILDSQIIDAALTDEQKKRKEELRKQISLAEFMAAWWKIVNEADQFDVRGDIDKARNRYSEAMNKLTSLTGRSLVPEDEHKKHLEFLSNKQNELNTRDRRRDVIKAVNRARASGDKNSEIAALKKLLVMQPLQKTRHQKRITELELDLALEAVQKLIDNNQINQAIAKLDKVIKDYPGNERGQSMLDDLRKSKQWRTLVREGHSAYDSQRWSEAMNKYLSANKLRVDSGNTLQNRIVECRFQIKLSEADSLRDAKSYEGAIKAYEEAGSIQPSSDAMVKDRIDAMMVMRDFEIFISNVRAAMGKNQFSEALMWLKRAGQLRPDSTLLTTLETDIRYNHYMYLGKSSFDRKDYKAARAHFINARTRKRTDEIKALIAKAEKKIEETSEP